MGPNAAFGSRVICKDPARILHGANLDGGTLVGDSNFRINLYKQGSFSLPFEFEQVIRTIHFVFLNAGQWLAEYLEEYVSDITDGMDSKHRCNACKVYDTDPSKRKSLCGACRTARYCT